MAVKVDTTKCTGCKSCEEVCPTESIKVSEAKIAEVKPDDCIDCNACIDACTTQAIESE